MSLQKPANGNGVLTSCKPPLWSFFSHIRPNCVSVIVPSPLSTKRTPGCVGMVVAVGVAVGVGMRVVVRVGVAVAVAAAVDVGVAVRVGEGVAVSEGVAVKVEVAVRDGDAVCVAVLRAV